MTKLFCDICLKELNDTNRFHGHKAVFPIHPEASKETIEARRETLEVTISVIINGPTGHRNAAVCRWCLLFKLNEIDKNI